LLGSQAGIKRIRFAMLSLVACAPFGIVIVGAQAGFGTLVGADLVEVHARRVVRLESVFAVAAIGVIASIGTAAVVRLFEELSGSWLCSRDRLSRLVA
jgi:3-dehydroquinate dehydratase